MEYIIVHIEGNKLVLVIENLKNVHIAWKNLSMIVWKNTILNLNNSMTKKSSIPGLSFSWKRALGITQAKQQISRKTGIPTTKAGMERKIGNAILKALLGK